MIDLFKSNEAVNSFEELVATYNTSEFHSPRRSTVLLLDYWRSFDRAVTRLEALLDLGFEDKIQLHFEYCVPPQAGKGKSSFTDLMIVDSSVAVGIEAKYMEPPYQIVSSWIKGGS